MAVRIATITLCLWALCPLAVWAQAAPDTLWLPVDTTYALPNVTVQAERDRVLSRSAPMRVTTLDAASIEATGAQTVAELLEARTGLFIKRYGDGGLATASLRGTQGTQTAVLVDGMRIADPQSGQVDLSLLPSVLLERVDVLHGAHAARHGSGSMGGTVRLHTLAPTATPSVRTTGVLGAYGRRDIGGVASAGTGRFSGLIAAEANRTERDFSYFNETLLPPERERRRGADRALTTAFGKVQYDGAHHDLQVTGWWNDVERGLPGASNAAAPGARQWDRHRRLLAHYHSRPGTMQLDVRGGAQHTRLRYVNPHTDTRTLTRTQAYQLSADMQRPAGDHWAMSGGLTAGLDRTNARQGVRRHRGAAYAAADGQYGRLALNAALRLDAYGADASSPGVTALSPQLGVNVQPLAWEGLRLKGHIGRAFRAPTFGERFSTPGGNPALRAERGWSAEGGAVARVQRAAAALQAEATVFTTRVRNQITWQPSFVGPGVRIWRPSNVGRVVSTGWELSVRGRAQPAAALRLNGGAYFTYTSAENRAAPDAPAFGHQLRYVPRQQLKLHAGAAWGPLQLDLNGRLVGPRYITADETQALAPYQVVDAQLRLEQPVGPVTATAGLAIENLLNEDYSIIRFYPMPPRHARLRITLAMHP